MLPVVRDLHFTSHMCIKYIYLRKLSPLLPNGSLICTRTNQKDKTECSRYLQKIIPQKEQGLQLGNNLGLLFSRGVFDEQDYVRSVSVANDGLSHSSGSSSNEP